MNISQTKLTIGSLVACTLFTAVSCIYLKRSDNVLPVSDKPNPSRIDSLPEPESPPPRIDSLPEPKPIPPPVSLPLYVR